MADALLLRYKNKNRKPNIGDDLRFLKFMLKFGMQPNNKFLIFALSSPIFNIAVQRYK